MRGAELRDSSTALQDPANGADHMKTVQHQKAADDQWLQQTDVLVTQTALSSGQKGKCRRQMPTWHIRSRHEPATPQTRAMSIRVHDLRKPLGSCLEHGFYALKSKHSLLWPPFSLQGIPKCQLTNGIEPLGKKSSLSTHHWCLCTPETMESLGGRWSSTLSEQKSPFPTQEHPWSPCPEGPEHVMQQNPDCSYLSKPFTLHGTPPTKTFIIFPLKSLKCRSDPKKGQISEIQAYKWFCHCYHFTYKTSRCSAKGQPYIAVYQLLDEFIHGQVLRITFPDKVCFNWLCWSSQRSTKRGLPQQVTANTKLNPVFC